MLIITIFYKTDYLIVKLRYTKMKQRIRLTESQLHKIIRKCVNEAINMQKRDVYSIEVYNVTREEEYYDAKAAVNYYDIDEAFQAAKELANEYKGDEDVINVIVFAGQYEVPNGDVYGDAEAIEVFRNK